MAAGKGIRARRLQVRLPKGRSAFLWGPRKTGKSFWLRLQMEPEDVLIDLLKTDVYAEYASRPALLRERYATLKAGRILIDEVQFVPDLLREVHWLIENTGLQFILTGSSGRKLRRGDAHLLGGRAWRYTMHPLTWHECEGFNLEEAMVSGLLPPHHISSDPVQELRAYIGDYLREEVAAEAAVRRIPTFAEFLRAAALTNGELLNYANVAREAGVGVKTVRSYFEILEDTFLAFRVAPWRKSRNRRLLETEKVYLFDVGVTNFLARRTPQVGTPEFGKAFEQFILLELRSYQAYAEPDLEIRFWRTSTGLEVDFILNDLAVALEVKGSARVHAGELRALKALADDQSVRRSLVVCLESTPRTLDGIEILPWTDFLDRLWRGEITG